MKKFRNLPAVCTLAAGFIACIIMILNQYSLKSFLWILACVMLGFYIAGMIIRGILNKIYRKEEAKRLELQAQQDEADEKENETQEETMEDEIQQDKKQTE